MMNICNNRLCFYNSAPLARVVLSLGLFKGWSGLALGYLGAESVFWSKFQARSDYICFVID